MKKRRNNRLIALLLTFCIMLSFTACDGGSSNKNTPDNSSVENETDNSDGKNKEEGNTNNDDDKNDENQQTQDSGFIPFDCYCELSEFRETISALSGDEFDALLVKENMPLDVAQRYVEMTKEMKVPATSGTNQRMTFSWNKNHPEYMHIGTGVFTNDIDYDFSTYQKNEEIIAEANNFISKLENTDDSDKVTTLDFCGYKVMFEIIEDAANYYGKTTTMEGYLILEDYVINIFLCWQLHDRYPDPPSAESFLAEVDFDMFNFYTLDEMIEIKFTGEPGSFFEHDWHEYE